jgi:hypothetical protein
MEIPATGPYTPPMSCVRLILATAGTLLLAPAPAVAQSRANDLELRCGAAVAYVREVLAQPPESRVRLVFSAEPFGTVDFLESGWWVEGSDPAVHAEAPADLIARDSWRQRSAVSACPSLRHFLDARAIAWGPEAVAAVTPGSGRLSDDARLLHISLPVVSDDGRRALLTFSHSGAGASRLLLERQGDGSWRAVAYQPLGVY